MTRHPLSCWIVGFLLCGLDLTFALAAFATGTLPQSSNSKALILLRSTQDPPHGVEAFDVDAETILMATNSVSRRNLIHRVLGAGATATSVVVTGTAVANAASSNPAASADKAKIVKGYERLNYLLDNWEKETTVCKTGGETVFGVLCERTPLKVMEYLGYKSMEDPLFKVEKTLMRLQSFVPDEYETEYQEAMENIIEKADEGSGMAFVSSWGEANPGGGKDRVELFIERSKNNVIAVRDGLGTIIRILNLKT